MKLSNIDVSRVNRTSIYEALLSYDAVSRQALAQNLGISLPTVTKTLKSLVAEGLVHEVETAVSTGGRKPSIAMPVLDARTALGMDITENHISLAAVNLRGEILAHVRLHKKFEHRQNFYDSIAQTAADFLVENSIPISSVLGCGVAMPGITSKNGAQLLEANLLGLNGPLSINFPAALPRPYRLFNYASAACMAENWIHKCSESFVFLCLSNSVGGAIVRNGEIIHGDNLRSAEFAHLLVAPEDPNARTCYCGQKGHYNPYGSARVLANHGNGRLEDFFAKVESGNAEANAVLDDYIKYLAIVVWNLRMSFGCTIVLGGYVGSQIEPYIERIKTAVAARSSFGSNTDYIRLCHHKFESTAVGAALHYINDFIQNI